MERFSGHRSKHFAALVLGAALTLGGVLTGFAQAPAGTFDGGGRVGGANESTFESGSYVVTRESGKTWSFATGTDGRGYFAVYEGEWGDWQTFEEPPAEFGWQPTAAEYNGSLYVVYPGTDGKYYLNSHDGQAFTGWQDISGDYRFGCTPYANVAAGWLWVYGVDGAGYLQYSYYNGSDWTPWAPVDAEIPAEAYEPYAVEWGGYNNVLWTATDGLVYWNRYDGASWTGTKALPGDYEFAYPPAATAYAPESKLYADGVGKGGAPYCNVSPRARGGPVGRPPAARCRSRPPISRASTSTPTPSTSSSPAPTTTPTTWHTTGRGASGSTSARTTHTTRTTTPTARICI